MKKTKMIAVLSALVLGLVITSCGNPSGGSLPEVQKALSELLIDLEDYTLQVGDLVFTNNKVLPYSEAYTSEQWGNFDLKTNKPVAVIFREANETKSALGVGLQQPTSLAWAKSGTPGKETIFKDIICTPKKDGENSFGIWNYSKTWEGDTDGRDNWSEICAVDNTASANPTNYPAFNYALNYGTTAGLTGTYVDNWFLPSIAELVELYTSKEKVNKVLKALGEKVQVIKEGWYWSSSQNYNYNYYAVVLDLIDGNVNCSNKEDDKEYVCVVRAF